MCVVLLCLCRMTLRVISSCFLILSTPHGWWRLSINWWRTTLRLETGCLEIRMNDIGQTMTTWILSMDLGWRWLSCRTYSRSELLLSCWSLQSHLRDGWLRLQFHSPRISTSYPRVRYVKVADVLETIVWHHEREVNASVMLRMAVWMCRYLLLL